MFPDSHTIAGADPALWQAIQSEFRRQEEGIELIASENYASPAVLAAQGTVLTNKYAEGYPGKRYYGGCEFVDVAETLALERVKKDLESLNKHIQEVESPPAPEEEATGVAAEVRLLVRNEVLNADIW